MPKKKKSPRKKRPLSGDPRRAAQLREEHIRTVYERQGDPNFTQVTHNLDGSRTIRLDEEAADMIRGRHQLFVEKFGREPGPDDPLFFDAEADTPQPMGEPDWDVIFEAFDSAGIDPAYAEAWRELGYIVTEMNRHTFTAHEIEAWEEAVERHQDEDE